MQFRLITLAIVMTLLVTTHSHADPYLEFSSGAIFVDTPTATARPTIVDLRLGISRPKHQFELALMRSLSEDKVNRLRVETPAVVSLLWHYIPQQVSGLKVHTVLGVSRVEVEADYPGVADDRDEYSGISYGIGFEESFDNMPRLKVSVDLLQLYRGEDLEINSVNIGLHYEF